jgi:hypothetical protein
MIIPENRTSHTHLSTSAGRALAIILLIDGARPDIFRNLLDDGQLPNIQKEILSQGTFRVATSCCPSTTGPAYLPFLTGCFPGRLNIPGIRWLDKDEFRRRRFGLSRFRSYNGIEALLFNRDLPGSHPTLFELFQRPYNVFSMITRGLPPGHNLCGKRKPFYYLYAHIAEDWTMIDKLAYKYLVSSLALNPDFVFAVLPGVDAYSHLNHPGHEKTLAAYLFVDFVIGRIIDKLKKQRRWDNTLLIITSDHGLTATHTHLDLALFLKARKINPLFYPIVWKTRPQAAVMISGNALGHIYWLGHNSQPGNSSKMNEEIKCELLARPEIDLLLSRNENGSILVESAPGRAEIVQNGALLSYLPHDADPLGYGCLDRPLDREEALKVTIDTQYPDGLVQIAQLFTASRTGDLVVISRNGYDLRKAYEWPEHHASHGSLCREHMLVPLIYNQTGWDNRPARTADLFNTILKWSGRPEIQNTDGRSLL